MDLISTLAAGVNGAESGTAQLFIRGTSTAAPWFEDFEGQSKIDDGNPISLDQYGGAQVYVDQYVRVLVYDNQGNFIREFTQGHSADVTEYIGPAFTGASYEDGDAGVNEPVTVNTILDRWKTVNGGIDWTINLGDTDDRNDDVSIRDALGPTTSMWCNVQDPKYGAVGDNVNDDTTPIQAALDDCQANGGGFVYFPPGIYRISGELVLPAKVSMLGTGPSSTQLALASATERILSTDATAVNFQTVEGMALGCQDVNTAAELILVDAAARILFRNCLFGNFLSQGDALVRDDNADQRATFLDCTFLLGGATQSAVDCSLNTSGRWKLTRCIIVPPATCNSTNGLVFGRRVDMRDCIFETSVSTSGTFSCFQASDLSLDATMQGCRIEDSGGATVTGIELGVYAAGAEFLEDDNDFPEQSDINFTAYSYTITVAQTTDKVKLGTRDKRTYYVSNNDGAVTLPADQYGQLYVNRTGDSACAYSVTAGPYGAECNIHLANVLGAPTLAQALNVSGSTAHVIGSLNYSSYHCVMPVGLSIWAANGVVEDVSI